MKKKTAVAAIGVLLLGIAAPPASLAQRAPKMVCSATPDGTRGYRGTCSEESSYNAFSMGVRCGLPNGRVHTYSSGPAFQGVYVRVSCPAGTLRLSYTFSVFFYT